MRSLKPHRSLVIRRRCALSTSCVPQALALRIDTHPVGDSVSVDPPIRPITQHSESQTWLAYNPPVATPRLLLPAPKTALALEEKVLGVSYKPGKDDILSLLSTRTINGLTPANGFLLSSTATGPQDDKDPVSERTLNLGKTIDILKDHLPTLLQSPLPSEILSPSIALQLFPSTHPHLPSVRGRMAYIAALWTSPVVWGRIPGIKVRLEILSIRMVKGGIPTDFSEEDESQSVTCERMIVKWRASSSPNGNGNGNGHGNGHGNDTQSSTSSAATSGPSQTMESKKEDPLSAVANSLPKFTITGDFCGLFIFEFDDQGRIKTHIIEDVEEDRDEAVQQHSKVITLTEWLLKKAKKSLEDKPPMPGLAFERAWGGRGPHQRFG